MEIPGDEEGGGNAASATTYSICEDYAKSPARIDPWRHASPLTIADCDPNTNLVPGAFPSKPNQQPTSR